MNQRLVESRAAVKMIGRERKARAAAPETGSRASLSRRSLALVSVLLGTPLTRMTSKPPRRVGAPPVVDAKGSLGSNFAALFRSREGPLSVQPSPSPREPRRSAIHTRSSHSTYTGGLSLMGHGRKNSLWEPVSE